MRSAETPCSPPKKLGSIKALAAINSPMPREISAKVVPARAVEIQPKTRPATSAAESADQGQQLQRQRQTAAVDHIERVHRQKSAQTVVHGMPEGEHAALSQAAYCRKGRK